MQQSMDRLGRRLLQLKWWCEKFTENIVTNAGIQWWYIPGIDGLAPKPSNRSIVEELPAGTRACFEDEGTGNFPKRSPALWLSWLIDKISSVDELLWAGGAPIDKRSSNISVPLLLVSLVPEMSIQKKKQKRFSLMSKQMTLCWN